MTEEEYVALRKETMQQYLESQEAVTDYLERSLEQHAAGHIAIRLLAPAHQVRIRLLEVIKEQNITIALVKRILGEIKVELDEQLERHRPEVTRG